MCTWRQLHTISILNGAEDLTFNCHLTARIKLLKQVLLMLSKPALPWKKTTCATPCFLIYKIQFAFLPLLQTFYITTNKPLAPLSANYIATATNYIKENRALVLCTMSRAWCTCHEKTQFCLKSRINNQSSSQDNTSLPICCAMILNYF